MDEKRESSKVIMLVLGIVIFALVGVVAYLIINSTKVTTPPTPEPEARTEETPAETAPAATPTGTTTPTTPSSSGNGSNGAKASIDNDLKSLDSLDLSSIENDYSEDSIADLQ